MIHSVAGILSVSESAFGVVSLTLFLAVFLFVEGVVEANALFGIRRVPNSGWCFVRRDRT